MGRFVVLGAGAVGGTIGGRLHRSGRDVVLVARGAHGEEIRSAGLRLREPGRDDVLRIPCVASPSAVDWSPGDVVVLATKVHQASAALDELATAAPPDVAVVCATNGLEGERLALRRFAATYGMVVVLPAEHLEPGVVTAYGAPVPGYLDVGRYPAGVDERAEAIAADLAGAGFDSRPDADVMRMKRAKLLLNLMNVLEAACGPGADTAELWLAAKAEAEAAMAAAGLEWASDEEEAQRRAESGMRMRPVDGERRSGGSTFQSLARATGETEADYLNGEIVLLGRLHGVATPVNALLQRVARELAAAAAPPASVTPEELRSRL